MPIHCRITENRYFLIITVSFFLPITNGMASTICYNEDAYPNVTEIRNGESGIEFVVAGINMNHDSDSAAVITLTNDTEWDQRTWAVTDAVQCETYRCIKEYTKCTEDIPEIMLSVDDARKLRSFSYIPKKIDQNISACVVDGENRYFGISFYAGEGSTGVGGIGRYNTKTEEVEVRRLPILRDSSVTHIAFDGKLLWIATAHHYECTGTPPAVGLIRYDWEKGTIHQLGGVRFGISRSGICGFVVHDIYITDESAWIATDLGLSQTDRSDDEFEVEDNYGWSLGWRHYVPRIGENEVMQWTNCADLYDDLLNNLPRDDNPTGQSSYDQLFKNLAKFNPHHLMKHFDSNAATTGLKE